MKKLIMGLALLTSMSAFARGLEDCKSLIGTYSCNYQGQELELKISKNSALNSVKISIAGDAQDLIVDGTAHKSGNDDSVNVAECNAKKEIVADNFFKNELKGSFAITKTAEGARYTMVQNRNSVVLDCTKK